MQQWLEMVRDIGIEATAAVKFIQEQQELARQERLEVREEAERARQEAERARQEAERQREHEIHILELQNQQQPEASNRSTNRQEKGPKLPMFNETTDKIDSYLQRFERYAKANHWDENEWATSLSALLSGKALDVNSRLSDDDAVDYYQLKTAILKRYNLTEEEYREKFRRCKPENDESPDQFKFRLKTYLEKWIELSGIENTFEGLRDLIIKEQVIKACPKDLGIHLEERAPSNMEELAKFAQQYLKARGLKLSDLNKKTSETSKEELKMNRPEVNNVCFHCKKPGHRAFE